VEKPFQLPAGWPNAIPNNMQTTEGHPPRSRAKANDQTLIKNNFLNKSPIRENLPCPVGMNVSLIEGVEWDMSMRTPVKNAVPGVEEAFTAHVDNRRVATIIGMNQFVQVLDPGGEECTESCVKSGLMRKC
jgi:hypothetical protein